MRDMVEVNKFGRMEVFMKVTGNMVKPMVMAGIFT